MALPMGAIIAIVIVSLFGAAGLLGIMVSGTIKFIARRRNKALDAAVTRDINLAEQGQRGV